MGVYRLPVHGSCDRHPVQDYEARPASARCLFTMGPGHLLGSGPIVRIPVR